MHISFSEPRPQVTVGEPGGVEWKQVRVKESEGRIVKEVRERGERFWKAKE